MEFIVKKTNELTQIEKQQICDLFLGVFEKEKNLKDFEKQFLNTTKGYSYHGLLLENTLIVGCYSCIPMNYMVFNQKFIFGLSVDTMINEQYRGNPYTLKKLANLVYDKLKDDNIPFVFGFPNDNVYLIRKKILKWEDIAELDYYILPIKIGSIKNNLKFLNIFTILYSKMVGFLTKESFIYTTEHKNIEKVNDKNFLKYRYSLFDSNYKIIEINSNIYFSYKIDIYEGIKTAYLIDISCMNKINFDSAVKIILEKELDIDVVLFVGKIDFKPFALYKVPQKYIPKVVYMSGKILDTTKISRKIYDVENWNVNISNFDVL